MKMEVEIISKENIKPSSPTPHYLRTYKLSLLDQLIPSHYAPIVLFYPMNNHTTDTSHLDIPKRLELLKKSLPETLTRFYPLAGKIKDDLSIECNDEGANYVETRVNCCLENFLSQPDLLLVHKFLPCELVWTGSSEGTYVTNIQVNVFECGGIAIGLCISHKILDGAALGTFLKAWTATACGSNKVYPNFSASSLFPTNDLRLRDSSFVMWGSLFKKGKCITKRFVFDASAIARLKAQATSSCAVKCPTRVETVSAFIWKCIMAASIERNGFQRPSILSHLVNLRRRMAPPLSENSIGNLLWVASAQCNSEDKSELHNLVGEVREAISKIDDEFVKKLRGHEGNSVISESLKEIGEPGSKDGVDYLGFTSWCKLGFYEADFGWGKPIWVSSIGMGGSVFMNLIILADTRCGDGIEAWMTLDEQVIAILERDPELLSLASIDPSPSVIGNSVLISS